MTVRVFFHKLILKQQLLRTFMIRFLCLRIRLYTGLYRCPSSASADVYGRSIAGKILSMGVPSYNKRMIQSSQIACKKLDCISSRIGERCARAIEQCQAVYDETSEDGFHGFMIKLNHLLQLSVPSALRFGARGL